MRRTATILLAGALALGPAALGSAAADPWNDESGKGRERGAAGFDHRAYGWDRGGAHGRDARIPKGHLPSPGECRIWRRGVPPGHQPPPYRC